MSNVVFQFTGSTPLMCHNPRLADPDDPIVKEIKALTSKQSKTADDRRAIEKLEWFGGLYTDPSIPGPVLPTTHIYRTLVNTAKITKKGTAVERAISFHSLNVSIVYDGPRDIDQLWQEETHRFRLPVVVSRARTFRMRPGFPAWSIVADAFLAEDILDFDILRRVVETAGMAVGLSEGRRIGYGRFTGEVVRK